MKKTRWFLAVFAVLALAMAACSSSDDSSTPAPEPTSADTGAAPDTGSAPASTALTITAPVGASNSGFAETEVAAPADTPFTIVFKNDDAGIPHNVQIFEGTDTSATPVWAPEGNALITGVDEVTYEVPALPAGTYTYNCLSHPTTMVGTLTVG